MLKQDAKKLHKDLYKATATPAIIEVPPRTLLMIDGQGDPDAPAYAAAVEALYTVAYTLRFALKNAGIVEYPVPPLEGLWWTETRSSVAEWLRRDEWKWTMMLPQPPQVDAPLFDKALETARAKKGRREEFDRLRLADSAGGPAAQILHVGPFSTEPETVPALHDFIVAQGKSIAGKHREVYLSNPKRTAPQKMRTIIRYAIE